MWLFQRAVYNNAGTKNDNDKSNTENNESYNNKIAINSQRGNVTEVCTNNPISISSKDLATEQKTMSIDEKNNSNHFSNTVNTYYNVALDNANKHGSEHIVNTVENDNINNDNNNNNNEAVHDKTCSTFPSSASHSCFCLLPSHEMRMYDKACKENDNNDNNNIINSNNKNDATSCLTSLEATQAVANKPLLRPIKDLIHAELRKTEKEKPEQENERGTPREYNNNNNNNSNNNDNNNNNNNINLHINVNTIASSCSLPYSLPLHTPSTESQSYSPIVFLDNTPQQRSGNESTDYSIQPSMPLPPSTYCCSEWTVFTSHEDASQPLSLSTGVPIQPFHTYEHNQYFHLDRPYNTHRHDNSQGNNINNNNSSSTSDSNCSSTDERMDHIKRTNQYMVRAFSNNRESDVAGEAVVGMLQPHEGVCEKSSCEAVCDKNISSLNMSSSPTSNHFYGFPKVNFMSLFHGGRKHDNKTSNKTSTLHKAERPVNRSSAMMEEELNNNNNNNNANNNNTTSASNTTLSSLNDTGSYHKLVHDSISTNDIATTTNTSNNNNDNNNNNMNTNDASRASISSPQTFIVSTGVSHNNVNNTNQNSINVTSIPASSLSGLSVNVASDPLAQSSHLLSYNSWNTISERTPIKASCNHNCNGFLKRITRTSSQSSSSAVSASPFSNVPLSPVPMVPVALDSIESVSGSSEPSLSSASHVIHGQNKIYLSQMKAVISSHLLTPCKSANQCLKSASSYCYWWWGYAQLAQSKLHHMSVEGVPSPREQLDQLIISSVVKSTELISECASRVWGVMCEDWVEHWYPQMMLVLGDEDISYEGEHRPRRHSVQEEEESSPAAESTHEHTEHDNNNTNINNNDEDDDNTRMSKA